LGVDVSGVMMTESVGNALVFSNNINAFSIFPYEFCRRPSTKDIFRKVSNAADEIISDGAGHSARLRVPMAIANTGASGHYIRPRDPHQTNGTTQQTITVGLPNGNTVQSSTNNCTLNLPQLPHDVRIAHIIPGLTYSSLISIGTLCDAGCEATFNKTQVIVKKDNYILITGPRDPKTGL
jgi:hypothetical protein